MLLHPVLFYTLTSHNLKTARSSIFTQLLYSCFWKVPSFGAAPGKRLAFLNTVSRASFSAVLGLSGSSPSPSCHTILPTTGTPTPPNMSLKEIVFLLHFRPLLFIPSKLQYFRKDWKQSLEINSSNPVPRELTITTTSAHIPTQSGSRQAGARRLAKVDLLAPKNVGFSGRPVSWSSSPLASTSRRPSLSPAHPSRKVGQPIPCHFTFPAFLRDYLQTETDLGQSIQGIAVTSSTGATRTTAGQG